MTPVATTWPSDPATALLAELVAQLDQQLPHARALRRELHRHPDLSGAERPTVERLRHAMPNFKPARVADTGFLVRVGPPGPAVAVRAELDALPVAERTGVEWAATNGAMHACGHDVHLAALWALLQAARHVDLPVGLVGLFQPREEVQPSGAEEVVGSRLLLEHEVRAVVGGHVQPRVPSGVVSTGVGAVNAAADQFDIVIHGQPGHGAYPHVAIDPVPVLAAIVLGLQELVGRTVDPIHPAVITVGRVAAGTAHNIIPETASLHGVIRTMFEEDRTHLHAAIRRLAEHTAAARGAHAEVDIVVGDPVLNNDRRLVQFVDPLLVRLGLPVAHEPFRSCGADDFSHYSRVAPILMMFVGTGGPSTGARHRVGLHHPTFLPAEESIRHLALALAAGYVGGAQLAR
ncbi:M20 metallopeptidase family protein [Propionicimonas sp.]|uniref:M20 metallopeptidase family protein n=1 Tax=Propionicimonas sp. TaxID=1955623 RepID=UPI0039E51426